MLYSSFAQLHPQQNDFGLHCEKEDTLRVECDEGRDASRKLPLPFFGGNSLVKGRQTLRTTDGVVGRQRPLSGRPKQEAAELIRYEKHIAEVAFAADDFHHGDVAHETVSVEIHNAAAHFLVEFDGVVVGDGDELPVASLEEQLQRPEDGPPRMRVLPNVRIMIISLFLHSNYNHISL